MLLNSHKKFRRRAGFLLNALCTEAATGGAM